MFPGPQWFIRIKRWTQSPPPLWRVALVLGVIALCLGIYGLETAGLLPDWMRAAPPGRSSGTPRF